MNIEDYRQVDIIDSHASILKPSLQRIEALEDEVEKLKQQLADATNKIFVPPATAEGWEEVI